MKNYGASNFVLWPITKDYRQIKKKWTKQSWYSRNCGLWRIRWSRGLKTRFGVWVVCIWKTSIRTCYITPCNLRMHATLHTRKFIKINFELARKLLQVMNMNILPFYELYFFLYFFIFILNAELVCLTSLSEKHNITCLFMISFSGVL